jgi:hypothetical protein
MLRSAILALIVPAFCLATSTGICVNGSGSAKEKLQDIGSTGSCTVDDKLFNSFSWSGPDAGNIKVSDGSDAGFGPGLKFSGDDDAFEAEDGSDTWKFQYLVTVTNPSFLIDAVKLLVRTDDWEDGTGTVWKYLCIGGSFGTALNSGTCSGTLHTLTLNPNNDETTFSTMTSFAGVSSLWVLDVVTLNADDDDLEIAWVKNQFRQIEAPQGDDVVPEPGAMYMLAGGLLYLAAKAARRRRRS